MPRLVHETRIPTPRYEQAQFEIENLREIIYYGAPTNYLYQQFYFYDYPELVESLTNYLLGQERRVRKIFRPILGL